jgi:aubergine-like protein
VIVLRDGCSSGEIRSIRESEVNNSLEALKLVESKLVSLTYIVIDKKTTQKFFGSYNGNASNPQAGTLISSDLVSENYDFYLMSQFSTRGTTVPTYYKVIYNDSKMEEGKLQELLYNQCYNYVNWTGSIKIPAPVQYAKKLCSFASQYVNENIESLESQLYFI